VTARAALAAAFTLFAGVVGAQAPDSVRPLTFDDFYRQVRAHHPVVRQARLVAEQAGEELRIARGAFDPTVEASWNQKTFGSTEYYNYVEGALKIPTPLGADVKIGYERAAGQYISPDRRTPSGGLVTAGISIPLGQRLLTDERRNAIAVARGLRGVAEGERAATVNKLLLQAAKDYGRWFEAWRRAALTRDNVALAEFRLEAVRRRYANGDVAAIDTVEALLEVQRRTVQQAEAEQALFASALTAAAYLWDARGAPVELPPGAVPAGAGIAPTPIDSADVPRLLALARRQHPELRRIAGRIEQTEAQRLFAGQQVIPFLQGELSALAAGAQTSGLSTPFDTREDFKAGATVRTPLLFMKERGRFNLASQRLEQQQWERDRLRREIGVIVRTALNDLAVTERLIAIQGVTVVQSRILRDGEQRRYENGESTLFLVNTRERNVLDEEIKLAALQAKYVAARAELAVAAGEPAVLPDSPLTRP